MVRTKKDMVASLIRWKICWIFDPFASWSSIRVASDLSARSFNSFISSSRILDGNMLLWYPFGAEKTTYDLRFSIAFSATFGTPPTTVLSTARSLFAVSSRHSASSSLLSPTAYIYIVVVSLCPRYRDNKQPTFFISMITLAMENATLTGLISTQSGTFLRSVCANREATPRRSFVIAFQSESCVWEFVERRSSSFETWSICQSFRRKDWPYYNSPWPKKVEFSRSGTLDGEWKEAVGSREAKSSSSSITLR